MKNKDLPRPPYLDTYYTCNKYSQEKPFQYEGIYFRDYFRDIPFWKLSTLLKEDNISLNGKFVLVASSGSGIDGYYLKKLYGSARLFFSDINFAGMEKLRSNFFNEPAVLTDNCCLAFKDNSFDYTYIAASLHHLKEPLKGLYELLRVAKRGAIVIEPNDSWLSRFFTKIGLAHEYETDHFNYVYRISKKDVDKISKALFYRYGLKRFFATHRIAKTRGEFVLLKLLNGMANFFCPHLGNYVVFVIKKQEFMPACLERI